MKVLLVLWLLMFTFFACTNKESSKQPVVNANQKTDTLTKRPVVSVVNDTLIQIQFNTATTNDTAVANLFMNGKQHTICEVAIGKADSIQAMLIPAETGGNIRFTQIVMPDNKKDGPFGQTISYYTPKPGTYHLIIGENMMAGDRWQGNFRIKVWVK